MSGYRESSFDPNAGGDYGPPARPFNWVQWTGVAFALVGIAIDLFYLAGQAGITRKLLDSPSIGVALPLLGVALINSRRQPGALAPQLKRQRLIALTVAAVAVVIGAIVAILVSKGA